ncbi:hypothetical protein V8E51_014588 [Hyaloscypha variabilis]
MDSEESMMPDQPGDAAPTAPSSGPGLQDVSATLAASARYGRHGSFDDEAEGGPAEGQPHVIEREEIAMSDVAANTAGNSKPTTNGTVSMLPHLADPEFSNALVKSNEIDGDCEQSMEGTTPDDIADAVPATRTLGPTLQNLTTLGISAVEHENNEHIREERGAEMGPDENESESEDDDDVEFDEEDDEKTCNHGRQPKRTKPITSLLQLAERGILKQLTKAIDGKRVTARYCCGGRVRSLPPSVLTIYQDEKPRKVSRLILRWDDLEGKMTRRIVFPFNDTQPFSNFDSHIETLAKRCETVGSLEESLFSINFDPHSYGIIDVITQVLVPGFEAELLKRVPERRGVRAKLLSLQVRSARGTVCKPLPKNKTAQYFGKLIVCLPYAHKGGQWEVSSGGHSTSFDFSKSEDNTTIHWAAFVGDCDYQTHDVEEGHQLVLIYNLFLSYRTGEVLRDNSTADPTLFPLYAGVKEMLEHPGFMKKGGILGFYCQYPCSHVSANAAKQLPSALQGVDMVVYSVFKSLGLKTEILPLLDVSPLDEMDENEYEREEEYHNIYLDELDESDEDCPVCGCCDSPFPSFQEWKATRPKYDRVGTKLHGLKLAECDEEAEWSQAEKEEILREAWPWRELEGVRWLNEPKDSPKTHSAGKGWEIALVNTSSCDQDVSTETFYSHLVILITVPKVMDRELTTSK